MAATFEFPSGLIGRITANFGCVHRHQHVLRVFGTKATFIYDDRGRAAARIARPVGGQAKSIEPAPLPRTKGELIPEFVRAHSRRQAPTPPRRNHEFDVLSACVAADRAADAGAFHGD